MAITDKITQTRDGGDPVVATVSTTRASGGATLACDDLDNYPQDTVHFITYQQTASGAIDYDTLQSFKGIVSGNNIGTVTLQHSPTGVDLGNSIGDYVELAPTASWSQDLYDALTAEHDVDGTHTTVTATTVTTSGNIRTTAGAVLTDTITEETAANGVDIDGLNIKDAYVTGGSGTGVRNASLDTTAGELGGTWGTSWAPTYANLTVGDGTVTTRTRKIGKTMKCEWLLDVGSTTSIGSSVTISLPETAATRYGTGYRRVGVGMVEDSGTALYDMVGIIDNSTTVLSLRYPTTTTHTGTAYHPLTTTVPITEASGDSWFIEFEYEVA